MRGSDDMLLLAMCDMAVPPRWQDGCTAHCRLSQCNRLRTAWSHIFERAPDETAAGAAGNEVADGEQRSCSRGQRRRRVSTQIHLPQNANQHVPLAGRRVELGGPVRIGGRARLVHQLQHLRCSIKCYPTWNVVIRLRKRGQSRSTPSSASAPVAGARGVLAAK